MHLSCLLGAVVEPANLADCGDKPGRDIVGWLVVVRSVDELWLNRVSEAYSY